MVCDVSKKIGGYTRAVFQDTKDLVKNKWDAILLVTGGEGDGKTTFVKLGSYFVDPKITIKQWAYNAIQFETIVDDDNLPIESAVVWDESDELAASSNDKIIQVLKRKFKRIRKKRLIIFLITPTFFDMNKYWAIFRTRCLFDIYADPKRDADNTFHANRGRLRFFNRDRKRLLYIKGHKDWDMKAVMPNFIDSFRNVPDDYPISEEELEFKKDEAMRQLLNEEKATPANNLKYRRECLYRFEQWVNTHAGRLPTVKDEGFVFGASERTIKLDRSIIRQQIGEEGLNPAISLGTGGASGAKSNIRLQLGAEEQAEGEEVKPF